MFLPARSHADLVIEVTHGVDNPTPIAIVPFEWSGSGFLPESISQIVSADLARCGQFAPLPEKNMPLSLPSRQSDIVFRDWRQYNMEYIVIGHIEPIDNKSYRAFFELYDVQGQRQLFSKTASGNLRDIAHYISDQVYEALTGFRGHFSTQVVYVQAHGQSSYQLLMADQDGARVQEILSSSEPIMSPTWSPDGKEVAYVSFENHRPAIFRQEIKTGKRQLLSNFPGLNNAPAWSPDGKKMALVLSKDDNPEIYVMDLETGLLSRITDHFGIDTEPSWAPDGKTLIFTSNRGGQPQIYRIDLATRKLERLTFDGDYNARGSITPDGKSLVLVHRETATGIFHIAVMDLATKQMYTVTETTKLDESPTVSPNGRMIMYATTEGDKGILSETSIDGKVKVRLPAQAGDVREPAWSPFP
jgi:TolB protein